MSVGTRPAPRQQRGRESWRNAPVQRIGLLPNRYFVMDVCLRVVFLGLGRRAAQVSSVADEFVAKRLPGKRVIGERHRNFRQRGGQTTIVSRGVHPNGLDVPEQLNPLLQLPLSPVDLLHGREEEISEQRGVALVRLDTRLDLAEQRLEL